MLQRLCLACLALLLLYAAPARGAAPPPIITARLEYEAAQGCPAVSVLRAEFARRQGHDPFVEVAPLRVVATIAREKGALAGNVKLYDSAGRLLWSRPTTPATDCQTVVLEMAGALAVRLDPKVYLPVPVAPPPPKPPKLTDKPPLVRVEPPAEVPAAGRVVLGLSSQLVIGAAGPAGGLVGHLGWRWPVASPGMALSMGMEFRFDAPSSAKLDDVRAGASMQAYLMGGSLVSCLHGPHLFGCALVSGGVIQVAARGVDFTTSSRELGFVGGGARFGFEETLRPWLAVRLYGEGLMSFRRLLGAINGVEVRGPSLLAFPLTGAAGVGLVAYFEGPR